MMKQFLLTPSMGKRLIGRAMVRHPAVREVLASGTLVIIAGTTNGYVAEEILRDIGQGEGFSRKGFRRGIVVPTGFDAASVAAKLAGDVVITGGKVVKGKTIFDVAGDLKTGDVILKGANAVDLASRRAAVYIGHPQGGTAIAAISAAVGRRVRLIVPVGLEKRVSTDVADLSAALNAPDAQGPRMLPLPGEVVTELEAIELLSGCKAELVAAGGIYGAEGAVFVAVRGSNEQVTRAEEVVKSLADEPLCEV